MLTAALVLGGGQGTLGDALVQVLALVLIATTLLRNATEPDARLTRVAWLVLVPCSLPLLQLLPIPESVWMWPEVRRTLAVEAGTLNVDSTQRWSLVPLATERALFWVLPAVAGFLAALQLEAAQRKALLAIIVGLAMLSAVLGLAQLAGGTDSVLRFYSITNRTEAVGFFANRNHLASLLAVALPLVVVGTARWLARRDQWDAFTVLGLLAGIGMVALLILGIAIAKSRAGLLLGMLGLLGSLPIVLGQRRRRGTRRVLAIAVALGLTLVVQFALFGILQRLEKDPLEDARFRFLPVAMDVAQSQAPLGSGLGGFRRAFEAGDSAPDHSYVNHAHNDYAELWIEAGPVAALAGLILLGAWFLALWRAWRGKGLAPGGSERSLALAAALGLAMLALHSLADYPLRTTALMAVAGTLAGVLAGFGRQPGGNGMREIPRPMDAKAAKLAPLFNP